MNAFLIQLAKLVVPFLIKQVVKNTETKADDELLERIRIGFELKK